jgi:hypothetical protein
MLEPRAESSAVDEARRRMDGVARVVVRPIASPVALGLYGLAAGTLVLAGQQLGWVDPGERKPVALILVAFPFLAQFVASLWSTLARDGVAATAMGVLALHGFRPVSSSSLRRPEARATRSVCCSCSHRRQWP